MVIKQCVCAVNVKHLTWGKGRKIHDERWVFLKDDPNFWVKCDADAIERICDANIPTDWLTKC